MTDETTSSPDTTPRETDNPLPENAALTPAAQKAPQSGNKALWMGTAAGIGSAALVAALLYAKKRK